MFLQSEFLSHQRTSFGVSSSEVYSMIITLFLPSAEESSGCSFSWSYQEWLKYQKFDIGQGQKLCWSHLASNSHKEVKRSRGQGVNDIFSLFQGKHLSWSTVFVFDLNWATNIYTERSRGWFLLYLQQKYNHKISCHPALWHEAHEYLHGRWPDQRLEGECWLSKTWHFGFLRKSL